VVGVEVLGDLGRRRGHGVRPEVVVPQRLLLRRKIKIMAMVMIIATVKMMMIMTMIEK
jgi:hypothetical protein